MSCALADRDGYRRPTRLIRRIAELENSQPRLLTERALLFTESMRATEGQALCLRWARAIAHILDHIHIEIGEDDLFAGRLVFGRYGIFYPELGGSFLDSDEFEPDGFRMGEQELEQTRRIILPYWRGKTFHEDFFARLPSAMKKLLYVEGDPARPAMIVQESATLRHGLQWVLDYGKVIRRGFGAIVREAEEKMAGQCDPARRDFYTAVRELGHAIRRFALRFAVLAEEKAQKEPYAERKEELLQMAERCRRVPWQPSESFADAIQAQWLTQLVSRMEAEYGGNISNGRMDQYLLELFRKDLAANALGVQQAREYLDELWCDIAQYARLKPSPAGIRLYEDFAHWEAVTIGGQLADGNDAANELSSIILDSAVEFPLEYPYLGVRIHEKTKRDFLREICLATRKSGKSPVLFNDRTITLRYMKRGVPRPEAFNYTSSGFSEVRLINRDTYLTGAFWLNLPAVLEMALQNGRCSANPAYRSGVRTGEAETLRSFEDVMAAFEKQLDHILDLAFDMQRLLDQLRPRHIACPLLSALHDLGMDSGRDISEGDIPGGRKDGCILGVIGFATVIDSLAALKTLVFAQKRCSLPEILQVLEKNFENREDLRQMCLHCVKYGERVDWVDEIGRHIDSLLLQRAHSQTNGYGGSYEVFYVPVTAHIAMGRVSGATPDGRFSGHQFSVGTTPCSPVTPHGPTVALASEEATQNSAFHSLGARVMFITLLPEHVAQPGNMEMLISLLETWSGREHWFLQFHVLTERDVAVMRNSPLDFHNLFGHFPNFNSRGYSFSALPFFRQTSPLYPARAQA